jgi:hypothetical protein
VDWKTFIDLIKAVAHLWPFLLIVFAWRFKKEIAGLIGRILKLKAFGAEIEAAEAKKELEIVKAAAPDEKKAESESRQLVEKAADEIASVDGVKLMELALTDPRQAVLQSFYLLSKALAEAAFPKSPIALRTFDDPAILEAAIKILRNNGTLSVRMLTQIEGLRKFHNTVRHSAYVPSESEAADFVFYSTSLREDLADDVVHRRDDKKP